MDLPLEMVNEYLTGLGLHLVCRRFSFMRKGELRSRRRLYRKIQKSVAFWLLRARCKPATHKGSGDPPVTTKMSLERVEANKDYLDTRGVGIRDVRIVTRYDDVQYFSRTYSGRPHRIDNTACTTALYANEGFCALQISTRPLTQVTVQLLLGNGDVAMRWRRTTNEDGTLVVTPLHAPFPGTWFRSVLLFEIKGLVGEGSWWKVYGMRVPSTDVDVLYAPYFIQEPDNVFCINYDGWRRIISA